MVSSVMEGDLLLLGMWDKFDPVYILFCSW